MSREEAAKLVLDKVDILDVAPLFLYLKPSGADYVGNCPFHPGAGESFVVSPERQMYYCTRCGARGGVVDMVMSFLHLTYNETLSWLASRFEIEGVDPDVFVDEQDCNLRVYQANNDAEAYFVRTLWETQEGESVGLSYYADKRQFPQEIIRHFGLGYDIEKPQDGFYKSLTPGKYSDTLLRNAFLTYSTGHVGPFHGRVVFPVYSVTGDVVAFSARTLKSKTEATAAAYRKYVNTGYPEEVDGFKPAVYSKSDNLFGLYQAIPSIIETGYCILVEGNADAVSMHSHGMTNCVASLGTALTANQAKLLHRFTNHVIVLYDGDSSGRHATQRAFELLLKEEFTVEAVMLPEGEDPDTYSQKLGTTEALLQYINEEKMSLVRFVYEVNKDQMDEDPDYMVNVIQVMEQLIGSVADATLQLELASECVKYAAYFGIDEMTVKKSIGQHATEAQKMRSVQCVPTFYKQEKEKKEELKTEEQSLETSTEEPLTGREKNLFTTLLWNGKQIVGVDSDKNPVTVEECVFRDVALFYDDLDELLKDLDESEEGDTDVVEMVKACFGNIRLSEDEDKDTTVFNTLVKEYKKAMSSERPLNQLVNHGDETFRSLVCSLCEERETVSRYFTKPRALPLNISEESKQNILRKEQQRLEENRQNELFQSYMIVMNEWKLSVINALIAQMETLLQKTKRTRRRTAMRLVQRQHQMLNRMRYLLTQPLDDKG